YRCSDILEADVPPRKRAFLLPLPDSRLGRVPQLDDRALLRARVNILFRDMPDHRRTAMLLDREVMYAREACAGSEDRSAAIAAHVRTLEAHVVALITQTSSLQTQLTTALGPIEILEARDPKPQEGQLKLATSISLAP
nr:hypothetical protein [Tanacetum cinerariifolium]